MTGIRKRRPGTGRAVRAVLLAALAAGLFAAARPWEAEGTDAARTGAAAVPVVYVADGDTVRVVLDGRREWVRLLRIDTPERGEPGFEAARQALEEIAGGRRVRLVYETPGVPARDGYGRLLAYLFVGERNVNVEMVRRGWSPFWKAFGEGRFAGDLRLAEVSARRAGRGLWGRRSPRTP